MKVTLSTVEAVPGTRIRADAAGSVDKATAAVADWGYLNFYRYRWAGTQESGSAPGTDKNTEDWVSVQRMDLPVVDGRFDGATSDFVVPSWAPGSSDVLARWECRVHVARRWRDASADAQFTVRVPAPAQVQSTVQRILGNTSEIDIVLDDRAVHAGDSVRGHLTFTTKSELPDADVAVFLTRERISHPLTKTPAAPGQLDGPRVQLGKAIALPAGITAVPFEIPTDPDLAPTGETVHSSLDWYVSVRVLYKGFRHGMDQARRTVVLYNHRSTRSP